MNNLMLQVSALSINRIAVFGLVMTVIYYFLLYNDGSLLNQDIQNVIAQVNQETAVKAETEKILKKEEEMRADVASLAKTYESVRAKIPIDFDVSELRTIVEQVSSASDLKIVRLSANVDSSTLKEENVDEQDANLVEKVAIVYSFEGNYGQIQNFMTQLAAIEKVIKIADLKIKSNPGSNGPSRTLTMDAILIGYKQATVASSKTNAGAAQTSPQASPAATSQNQSSQNQGSVE